MLCDEMPFLLKTSELQPNSQLIAWTDESEDKGNEVLIRTLKKYIDDIWIMSFPVKNWRIPFF